MTTEKNLSGLPNQSCTWNKSIISFDDWKKLEVVSNKSNSERCEFLLYLSAQLRVEGECLKTVSFESPLLGLVNYLGEENPRAQEIMLAYLSLVIAGDLTPARKLIAGQRLQIGLHPEYVQSTRCYG